ncbi:MAG: hypothetical protein FP816_20115 [Desulfobacteraceae bacterium]|nr:hypothetical protein [Desulfobacteraceae bacterium]
MKTPGVYYAGAKLMRGRFLFLFMIAMAILVSIPTNSMAGDLIEKVDSWGKINWTAGYLEAKGFHKTSDRKDDGTIDWERVLAEAREKAFDHLLKTVKAVRIQGEMTLGEMEEDEAILVKIMDMVNKSAIVNQEYGTDGRVEVTMGFSFFGGFSQLILPMDIEHVESIQSLGQKKNETESDDSIALPKKNKAESFTGFIIDARGLSAAPSMTIKILNENGDEIYGSAFVSREVAVQNGMCLYESDMASSIKNHRVSGNPMVIKALRTHHFKGSDLVIRNTDALKIRSSSEHLAFLALCRVVIVIDPLQDP